MRIIASSDWHIPPSFDLPNKLAKHIDYCEECLAGGYRIILPGDIFDALEFGWDAYRDHPVIKRLSQWDNLVIIEGNHDRKNPYLPTKLNVVVDNILFSHWFEFDLLWSWLPIYRFPIPDFIRQWYRTPAKKKKEGKLRDYHLNTAQIEFQAMKFCVKHDYKACIGGHTHSPFVLKREGYILANCGDMIDSFSFLTITDGEVELHYL